MHGGVPGHGQGDEDAVGQKESQLDPVGRSPRPEVPEEGARRRSEGLRFGGHDSEAEAPFLNAERSSDI